MQWDEDGYKMTWDEDGDSSRDGNGMVIDVG